MGGACSGQQKKANIEDNNAPKKSNTNKLEETKLQNGQPNENKAENDLNYEKPEIESDIEEEEEVMELPPLGSLQNKKPKQSVSAEVFGKFNQKGNYTPKVVEKNEDVKMKLQEKLNQAFMFSNLEDKEKKIVLDAMEEVILSTGNEVIKQGDDGNVLFVVYSGKLSCHRVMKPGEDPTYLRDYVPGDCFGELALLYNCPRAATIKAEEDSVCYSLDRDCFNHIVRDSTIKKRERYEEFLSKIELLSELTSYERTQVSDCLNLQKFSPGDKIIKEGEMGEKFYLIESGNLSASKMNASGVDEVVHEHKENDYFGELALLRDEPRKATITCNTDVTVAWIDRNAFKRLLGPLTNVLERNKSKYANLTN